MIPMYRVPAPVLEISSLVNMVGLVDVGGGREGRLGCTYDQFWGKALADRNLTVGGDCLMNE